MTKNSFVAEVTFKNKLRTFQNKIPKKSEQGEHEMRFAGFYKNKVCMYLLKTKSVCNVIYYQFF